MDNNLPTSEPKPEVAPSTEHKEPSVTPSPVEHHEQATAPAAPSSGKPKNPMLIGMIAVAVIILGVGGYFLMDMLNTPAKVKGKAQVVQPAFSDFSRAMNKIDDYMLDTSGKSDSDSIERSVEKGKNLIKEADRTKKTLDSLTMDMNLSQTQNYKKAIDTYRKKADEVEKNANENITLGNVYVEPLRKIEKLTVDITGASNYLYSDPQRYTTALSNAVKQLDSIESDLKNVKASGDMQRSHELFIKTLEAQTTFLNDVVQAVNDRESGAIAKASQDYAQNEQQLQKDTARIEDKMKETNQDLADDLKDLQDKVQEEYSSLKNTYKF